MNCNRMYISCSMTDKDVVEKLCNYVGLGTVYCEKLREDRKQVYTWRIGNRKDVIIWIKLLYPLMGRRRQEKINLMLKFDIENPKKRQDKGLIKHGTRTMYNKYNCRCDLCKKASHQYRINKIYIKDKNVKKN